MQTPTPPSASEDTKADPSTITATNTITSSSPLVVWLRTPPPPWLDTAVQILLAVLAITVSLQSRRRILAAVLASLSLPSILSSIHRLSPALFPFLSLPVSSKSVPLSSRLQALSTSINSRDTFLISKLSSIDASLLSLSTTLSEQQKNPNSQSPSALTLDQRAELHSLRARLQTLHTAHDTLSARLSSAETSRTQLVDDLSQATAQLDSVRRSETSLRHDAATHKARLDRLPRLEERLNSAQSTIDTLNTRLEQLIQDNEVLRLQLLDSRHNPSSTVRRPRSRRNDYDEDDNDERGVVDRLRHRMDELTGRSSSSSRDAPDDDDHHHHQDNPVSTAASVIQGATDALVPGSILRDEVVGAVDSPADDVDHVTGGVSWPSAVLEGGTSGQTGVSPSRVDGLPDDGGFAGAVDRSHDNAPQLPAVQGEGAFAFSRDEFEKPSLAQHASETAEREPVVHDGAHDGEEEGQEFNALQRGDSVVLEDEEVLAEDEEVVVEDEEVVTEDEEVLEEEEMVPKDLEPGEEEHLVAQEEETNDISDIVGDTGAKVAKQNQPTSYLESLERQVADRIVEATDTESVESSSANDDDIGDVNIGSIEIGQGDEGHEQVGAPTPVESEESSIAEVEESENAVYEKEGINDLKNTRVSEPGGKDVSEWSSVSGESERTAVEDGEAEADGKPEEDRESAEAIIREASELVKRGRRRGLAVEDADKMFQEASSKLEALLERSEHDASMRSRAEGELGSCLVSWAKVNIADGQARMRLERAKELLQKRAETKGDDATALFNGGLCMCLLAATGEPAEARGCYEVACELYERLLEAEPQSRIGCFNCGLTYISLGRIAIAAGDDSEMCRSIVNKAVERFEKALLLRPGDGKAVSYLEECRSQLDAIESATETDAVGGADVDAAS